LSNVYEINRALTKAYSELAFAATFAAHTSDRADGLNKATGYAAIAMFLATEKSTPCPPRLHTEVSELVNMIALRREDARAALSAYNWNLGHEAGSHLVAAFASKRTH